MNNIIIPPRLRQGDRAVIISPAGSTEAEYISGVVSCLESWGLEVALGSFAQGSYGRYSGTVEQRLLDLQSAMDDEHVRLILCSRGGYGTVHLLEQLDFTQITKQPKWLVGYSDITAIHQAFRHNNLVSLHAPMARHLAESPDNESSSYLKQILFSDKKTVYKAPPHLFNIKGNSQGTLFGGNLAVLCGLSGSRYMQTSGNAILFIEDIAEVPYKIDRMMWNLKLSGVLAGLSGLIVGQFTDCEEDPLLCTTIYELIGDMVKEYNYPVVFNFPVGHTDTNYPMIHGADICLSVEDESVIVECAN